MDNHRSVRPMRMMALSGRLQAQVAAQASSDLGGKKVLIIGGTGRVGSSTASALINAFPGISVSLASRNSGSYDRAVQLRPELNQTKFIKLDIDHADSVKVRPLEIVIDL